MIVAPFRSPVWPRLAGPHPGVSGGERRPSSGFLLSSCGFLLSWESAAGPGGGPGAALAAVLAAALAAVSGRGEAEEALEVVVELGLGGEARPPGDVRYGQVGARKQLLRPLDAATHYVAVRG
jgi:hypothetical protein